MKIAGRVPEIQHLTQLIEKDSSSFLAVYGRRRIGKTYLIRQVYQKQLVFECSGLHESDLAQQLENFGLTLAQTAQIKQSSLPKTWLQAFSLLSDYLKSLPAMDKKVIFLDEIAWFETPRSGFLAALDNFWNQFCSKRDDIILVICGSAAAWIIDKVINNRGGLHNRITDHIQLMPFTLKETKEFLEMNRVQLTLKDIVQLYMCVGGVPYYLKDVQAGRSVPQLLDDLFFTAQANLKNEFRNLYAALFKNSDLHVKVVKALASKNKGLTRKEIIEESGIASGGTLSVLLEELIVCGFIKVIFPISNAKDNALYRLVDEYSIFYFKFLENNRTTTSWLQLTNKASFKIWSGYAFENLCFKHVYQIKKALEISGIISNEYSWVQRGDKNEKGTQIDFIIDRDDNCMNLLELKYYDSTFEVTKAYAEQLREKASIFKAKTKTKKNIFITILTLFGAKKNEYYLSTITNELTVEALFIC